MLAPFFSESINRDLLPTAGGIYAGNADVRITNDRKQRVQDERHDCGSRADATDERQWDKKAKQGKARHCLKNVRDGEDRPAYRRPSRHDDTERKADGDGPIHRYRGEGEVARHAAQGEHGRQRPQR